MKKNYGTLVLILTMIIVVALITTSLLYKPSIHDVKAYELEDIDGIGEVLATRVIDYISDNPKCDIDDLLNVQGIGEKRLKLIKKEYR